MRLLLGIIRVLMASLVLSGCVASSVERSLSKQAAEQKSEFKDILGRVRHEPVSSISWEAAYKRLMDHNLALRQSAQQLEDSEKQTRRQWMTLVPKVAGYLSLGSNISSLTDFSGDDLTARLIANFNIPSPFEFYASLYAVALQNQNAKWSVELDKRRAYAQLYSLFLDAGALRTAEVSLADRLKAGADSDLSNIAKSLKALAAEARGLERRRLYHRNSVNQLLNTPGGNWDLTGRLPLVSYEHRFNQMKIGEDFGKLALNLYAIQVEGAILRLQRVKFQQWPSINFGFSNPPLYSNTGENGFSSDDLTLFSGANKSIDLADVGGREGIQDAEIRLKFTREQLRQRMEFDVLRILQIASSYEFLLKERSRLQREIERTGRPGSAEAAVVLKDLATRSQLNLQLAEIRQQIQQLDLQFLIWDERFWNS